MNPYTKITLLRFLRRLYFNRFISSSRD